MKANRRKGKRVKGKLPERHKPQDVPRLPGDTSLNAIFDRRKP